MKVKQMLLNVIRKQPEKQFTVDELQEILGELLFVPKFYIGWKLNKLYREGYLFHTLIKNDNDVWISYFQYNFNRE